MKGEVAMYERQYYFDYEGKKYPCGTILKVDTFYTSCSKTGIDIFEFCIPEKGLYKLYNNGWYYEENFCKMLVDATDKIDENYLAHKKTKILESKLTLSKEISCIDGMGLAWLWYIFLMVITLFFNGFYFYWAYVSAMFFVYRYHALKKHGYKRVNWSWYKLN